MATRLVSADDLALLDRTDDASPTGGDGLARRRWAGVPISGGRAVRVTLMAVRVPRARPSDVFVRRNHPRGVESGHLHGLGSRAQAVASAVALAVAVGVPVTFAVLHQGFPVTDPDLRARDVWVTNGQELLAGRLNRQIEELDAAVATASNDVDVFQDGDDVFLLDASVGSVERIDPSFTTLTQRIDVPLGSRSRLRRRRARDPLAEGRALDHARRRRPLVRRRRHRPDRRARRRRARGGERSAARCSRRPPPTTSSSASTRAAASPRSRALPKLGAHQLAAVGERAVVFDEDRNAVRGRRTRGARCPSRA